jgi:hypothetical protein
MLRIPHCLDNRLTVNCEILREREREKSEFRIIGGGAVRGTTKMEGGVRNNKLRLEGSQVLPTSPSGRVRFDLTLALEIF